MAKASISLDALALDDRPGWQGEHAEVLLEVMESMTSAEGSRSALNRLAELALRATGADHCAILVRDPSGRRLIIPAAGA